MSMQDFIKPIVRGCYDIQPLRIEMGNRIVANFKALLGIQPSEKEEKMDNDAKKILADLRKSRKRLADSVPKVKAKGFKGNELISSYAMFVLIGQYEKLLESEKRNFKELEEILQQIPIYHFMDEIKGIGPAMAGIIISEVNIHKAEYPSSLWKYAGLDVAEDGKGRSRRKEHQIDITYINKNGKEAIRKGITFNPFLKTKLIGVLGPSFLKAGKDNKYAKIYYDYKTRLENHPEHANFSLIKGSGPSTFDKKPKGMKKHKEVIEGYEDKELYAYGKALYAAMKTKGHRHNMAIRYMVKRFLVDLHIQWRRLEDLPVHEEYAAAKLGIRHHGA